MGLCGWSHQRNQISLKAWLADLPTVGRKYSHVSTGASSTTLNQLAADVDSGCTRGGRNPGMLLALTAFCDVTLCVLAALWIKRTRNQREMERHSTTAEELHSLLASNAEVLLFDVRQLLDLLAYPEIIPGAKRIPPSEVLEKPSLIPSEKDSVVYCTCPNDKTSRAVLGRALEVHLRRVKFLKGGLAAWKANSYPVEPYREVFQ